MKLKKETPGQLWILGIIIIFFLFMWCMYPTANAQFFSPTDSIDVRNWKYLQSDLFVGWGGIRLNITNDSIYYSFEAGADFDTTGGVVSLAADRIDSTHVSDSSLSMDDINWEGGLDDSRVQDGITVDWKDGKTVEYVLDSTVNAGILEVIDVTDDGGLNISWTVGVIYTPALNVVTTTSGSGGCTNNLTNYLYWTTGTALTLSTTAPDLADVSIATIHCQESDILELHEEELSHQYINAQRHGAQELFPVLVANGLIVGETAGGTPFDVTSTAGAYYTDAHKEHDVPEIISGTTPLRRWFHSSGTWTSNTAAIINPNYYNNLTDTVAVTNNRWTRSMFMIDESVIHWIFAQEEFASEAGALGADNPSIPEGLDHFPTSTALVIQQGASDFSGATFIDIRPSLGNFVTTSGGVITDHGSLAGLGDDDHTQYFKESDTGAFALTILASPTITGAADAGGATSLEIPNGANPTTDVLGELAQDSDDDAFEVYDGSTSMLIPFREYDRGLYWNPDLLTDTIPFFYCDSATYPGGIKIQSLSILTSVDGTYELKFFSYTAADPPVLHDYIDTLNVGASDQRVSSETFEDADASSVDVGQFIYILTPSTDIDWIFPSMRYYIKDND